MLVNIWLWGLVSLPLALLLRLHKIYIALFRNSSAGLWDALRSADSFEAWEAAARALDRYYGLDAWRRIDQSGDYAWALLGERLAALERARAAGAQQALVHLLQSGLVRNLGNMTAPALYNGSFAGTKRLIEAYVRAVCAGVAEVAAADPGNGPLLRNMRQSFGRTTLVLQGGSIFGLYHLGVARALFLRGLLPKIVTGTGTGALIAALLATHTDGELAKVLDGELLDLSAFWRSEKQASPSRWATLRRRLARLCSEGYLLDAAVLAQCVRANANANDGGGGGDLTFEEAFHKTGRTLNIMVGAGGADAAVPAVLNYVTAPNVLVWTAAVASNVGVGVGGPIGAPGGKGTGAAVGPILCRTADGRVAPWPLADTVAHAATPTRDAPLQRVSQLFNVNHFVVSQARPYLVPFLPPSLPGPGPAVQGWGGVLARLRSGLARQTGRLLHHRLDQAVRLGWVPRALGRLVLDEQLPGAGGEGADADGAECLVLVPSVSMGDYLRLLDAPTPAAVRYWLRKGEQAVWPAVAALEMRCLVELALEEACG